MSIWGVSEDETVFLKSLLVILRVPGKRLRVSLLFFLLVCCLLYKSLVLHGSLFYFGNGSKILIVSRAFSLVARPYLDVPNSY
jgi:hypothetical protein